MKRQRHAVIIYNGRNCVRRLALSGVCHVMSARKNGRCGRKGPFLHESPFSELKQDGTIREKEPTKQAEKT